MPTFKKMFNEKILNGTKTQTRRLILNIEKPRYIMKVGEIYKIRNSRWKKEYIGLIGCTRRFTQQLRDISHTDVLKEGFHDYDEFILGFLNINSHRLDLRDNQNPLVIVYEFELLFTRPTLEEYDGTTITMNFPLPAFTSFEQHFPNYTKRPYMKDIVITDF